MRRRLVMLALALDGAYVLFMLPIVFFVAEIFDELPMDALALGVVSLLAVGMAARADWRHPTHVAWAVFVAAHLGLLVAAWWYFDRTWFWLSAAPVLPLVASLASWESPAA